MMTDGSEIVSAGVVGVNIFPIVVYYSRAYTRATDLRSKFTLSLHKIKNLCIITEVKH